MKEFRGKTIVQKQWGFKANQRCNIRCNLIQILALE
jgi:hypothetical protein